MIISSGQILTGRAIEDIPAAIINRKDADGWADSAYKAVCVPAAADVAVAGPSNTNGSWIEIGDTGNDVRFLGVIGDDTSPQANKILSSDAPVLNTHEDYHVKKGDVVTFERNGVLSVLAGGDIVEGDLLALGEDGTFIAQSTPSKATALGRAYGSAEEGERFIAYIQAL